MVKIWQEQITLLGVIDTGALLASPKAIAMRADGRFFEVSLSQAFLEYGLWQDYGTGRETPRGNSGDIGRTKVRQRRKWFSRKYYASVMNIKEFYEDNIGRSFTGILSDLHGDVIKVMYSRFNYEICRIFVLWKKTRTSLSRKINKCCPCN